MLSESSVRRCLTTLVLAAAVVMTFTACGYGSPARPGCADAVLDDWTKGTLGSGYSPDCYEAAIDALPEDLRAYTSAADDIARVAISAGRSPMSSRRLSDVPAENDPRAFPTEVALLVGLIAVIGSCGLGAALIRRRRA